MVKDLSKLMLRDLWNPHDGTTPYHNGAIYIWVDFNSSLRPFIKARVSGFTTKSFDYTSRGLIKAKQYVVKCLSRRSE